MHIVLLFFILCTLFCLHFSRLFSIFSVFSNFYFIYVLVDGDWTLWGTWGWIAGKVFYTVSSAISSTILWLWICTGSVTWLISTSTTNRTWSPCSPIMISAYKRCLVRLYLQLFVGGLMSYLCYLWLFVHSGVHHILCCFSSSCVPYFATYIK
jgi:hypothetical protein